MVELCSDGRAPRCARCRQGGAFNWGPPWGQNRGSGRWLGTETRHGNSTAARGLSRKKDAGAPSQAQQWRLRASWAALARMCLGKRAQPRVTVWRTAQSRVHAPGPSVRIRCATGRNAWGGRRQHQRLPHALVRGSSGDETPARIPSFPRAVVQPTVRAAAGRQQARMVQNGLHRRKAARFPR